MDSMNQVAQSAYKDAIRICTSGLKTLFRRTNSTFILAASEAECGVREEKRSGLCGTPTGPGKRLVRSRREGIGAMEEGLAVSIKRIIYFIFSCLRPSITSRPCRDPLLRSFYDGQVPRAGRVAIESREAPSTPRLSFLWAAMGRGNRLRNSLCGSFPRA